MVKAGMNCTKASSFAFQFQQKMVANIKNRVERNSTMQLSIMERHLEEFSSCVLLLLVEEEEEGLL